MQKSEIECEKVKLSVKSEIECKRVKLFVITMKYELDFLIDFV